jgi:hypothetical protein
MADKLPDDVKKRAEAKYAARPHLEIQDPGAVWIRSSGKGVCVCCEHENACPALRRSPKAGAELLAQAKGGTVRPRIEGSR